MRCDCCGRDSPVILQVINDKVCEYCYTSQYAYCNGCNEVHHIKFMATWITPIVCTGCYESNNL